MPRYAYTALLDDGGLHRGEMTAASSEAVVQFLEGRREHAVSVSEANRSTSLLTREIGRRGASHAQVTLFTRQLAWLLRAGLTLPRALGLLGEEFHRTPLSGVIEDIHASIRTGDPLSDALAKHPAIFAADYVSMIRIAEASGTLVPILEQAADARERDQAIRRKLVSALIYPSVLVAVALSAVVFILVAVVPRIKDMMAGPQERIPASAARLIGLSDWLIAHGWIALAFVLGLAAAGVFASRYRGARRWLSGAIMRLPLVGPPLRLGLTVRFSRMLATLLSAGVGLASSFELVGASATVRDLADVSTAVGIALRKGEDFLAPITASWIFPKMFGRILRVGEETGNLVPSLRQVTAVYEEELSVRIERALKILEPAIILVLSAAVGLIIAAVMDGIISVNDLAL